MIKIIIPIISLDSILMIKHSGSGTPNDDQKQHRTFSNIVTSPLLCQLLPFPGKLPNFTYLLTN